MAKRMQKSSKEFRNSITPPTQQFCPAVSVIIPMYNAEKYIGECLESVLAQTFDNYEVIVVDDCSIDNSATIVKSYIPKFDGRLKLYRMDSNTGSGAMPRNKGLNLARGEYIFFTDADDLLTKTALQELKTLAKDYDADVINCEKSYRVNNDGTGKHIFPSADKNVTFVDKPTLESDNPAERVQNVLQGKYRVPPWTKFVRRSLIFEHKIFFPWCAISEDDIWTYGLVFYAKKLLRVPNLVYIHRSNAESVMRNNKTPQETINFWISPVILGLKALEKFMSKHEFFQQNPQYRYDILEFFINIKIGKFFKESLRLQPFVVYETIKQEFGDKLGDYDVLVSALCTLVNTQQKMAAINQQRFNEFAAQAQARIAELEAQLKTK